MRIPFFVLTFVLKSVRKILAHHSVELRKSVDQNSARNTNLHWNAVMEGVIRISHLIELVYSQKIPKKLVKKILWYYLVTIPNYV